MSETEPSYLKVATDAVDLGAMAAVGTVTFCVYLAIRRFVWRKEHRNSDFKPKPSQVIAHVNQSALGAAVGVNRQNVSLHIKKLEKLGWLKRLNTDGDKTERVYELGFKSKRKNGDDAEIFFADQRLASCRKTFGDSLKKMQMEARAEHTERVLFGPSLVSPARQGLSRQKDKACLAPETSLVSPARHQNRESRNRESSNRESPKSLRGASPSRLRSRRSRGGTPAKSQSATTHDRTHDRTHAATPPPPVPVDPLLPKSKKATKMERIDELKRAVEAAKEKNNAQRAKNTAKSKKKAAALQSVKNLEGGMSRRSGHIKKLYVLWRKLLRDKWPGQREGDFEKWFHVELDRDEREVWKPQKAAGQCSQLVKRFDAKVAENYLRYAVANWEKIHERFKKIDPPVIPTIGFLLAVAAKLVPEMRTVTASKDIEAEVEAWFEAHPGGSLPQELQDRLKSLKVGGG